ncbi:MAG: class I SAM-dependent methyltransferase [Phormidesmis sp.]
MLDNEARIKQELEIFNQNVNVHELPKIYHYWSNKHLRPWLEEYGISNPDDLFVNYMINTASSCGVEKPAFVSIGSGNCDTEVRVAKRLKDQGLESFSLECIDLNPTMLNRGRELADKEGILENMSFIELDFNQWKASKEYVSVIANQSLHHIQNLEGVFNEIKKSLHPDGTFITSDMIGRNGHQRWPEALDAVHNFWKELPESYRYNHQLKRVEMMYENWDCSTEGFEGIRAQDILPLLIKNFNFELFIGFANVIDVFVDRGFGHNFDPNGKWDTDFIDRVHQFDETSIRNGSIKPTHIMAVMKKKSVSTPSYSRNLSPEHCMRKVPAGAVISKTSVSSASGNRSLLSRIFRRFH